MKKTKKTLWEQNRVQFPRLLAEIRNVGLTPEQAQALSLAMDLPFTDIDELLERALKTWERHLKLLSNRTLNNRCPPA